MAADFEVSEVLHLGLGVAVKLEDLLHEILVSLLQLLTIFLEVEDGSGLRLDLVDVHVVDSGNGVRLLLSLGSLLPLGLSHFALVFASKSKFGGDAVLEMASLLLPEIVEFLALGFSESEPLTTNVDVVESGQFRVLVLVESVGGDGHVSFVLVSTGVHHLDLVEVVIDVLLEVLPRNLIIFILLLVHILRLEVHNECVFEVVLTEN